MSLKAYQAVWEHSTARGTDLLVLLALADFADEAGWSWPSIDAIAKKARISQRATQVHVKALESSGQIEIELQAGVAGTNRYRILGLNEGGGVQDLRGAGSAGGVQIANAKANRKSNADLHPNRKEPSGSVKTPKASSQPAADDPPRFEDFWRDFPKQPNGTKPELKQAKAQWDRLKVPDRAAALSSLPNYRRHLEQNPYLSAKHAFRYLRDRSFEAFAAPPLELVKGSPAEDPDEQARKLVARVGV